MKDKKKLWKKMMGTMLVFFLIVGLMPGTLMTAMATEHSGSVAFSSLQVGDTLVNGAVISGVKFSAYNFYLTGGTYKQNGEVSEWMTNIQLSNANGSLDPLTVSIGTDGVLTGDGGTYYPYEGTCWFVSQKDQVSGGYVITLRGAPEHTHSFDYSATGATITATCNADGCPLDKGKASITIVKPSKEKYRDTNSELATIDGDTNVLGKPTIVYKQGTNALGSAPTEPGTYTANITLGGKTATVEYTIAKGDDPDYSDPSGTLTGKYGNTLSDVELPAKWSWKDSSTKITATGEQSYTAIYTPENTVLYATVEKALPVKVDRGDNPAEVLTAAVVTKGGHTVDLSENVDRKDVRGEVSYSISSTGNLGCSVNPETGVFTSGDEPGKVEVKVSISGDEHYYSTEKYITVQITDKEIQTLEFESDSVKKTYGDEDFSNALSGAKTDVSYLVTGGKDVADVDNNGKVTIKKIGEAVITANAAETDDYIGASTSYILEVGRKSITVKADDIETTIGEAEPELTATVTGLVGTDTVEYEIERESGNSLGKYTITPYGDKEQGNYAVSYETGILTIKEGEKYIRTPIIKTISSDMIAVETVEGYVYGISADDDYPEEWTSEGEFTDLEENTQYTVYMKLDGEEDDKATSTKVTTNERGKETSITEEHEAIGDGFVRTETRINKDAPVGKIENLTPSMISSFFGEDSEEINKVKNGSTLLVFLKVVNADDSTPEDDKKKIEDMAKEQSDAQVAQFIDLSLYKQIDNEEPSPITNLNNNNILVRISIPENLRIASNSEELTESDEDPLDEAVRTFYIARVHEGEADILDTTTDGDDIIFETDRFSTYALLYSDSAVNPDPEPTPEPGAESVQSANERIMVVKNKSDISRLFSKYGETGYKYKFKVENKAQRQVMNVSKKGRVKVKKVGTATIALFRKVKGGSWSKIEEQTLTAEKPNLPKKVTSLKVGDKVYATSFITNTMISSPTSYVSSKPEVASIDSTGLITVHKSGKAKISIIYGSGKGAAKYKVKLKIQ
ncbi:MBG domain-containing protein [Lachnospiraceae bacterium C1.1]|nr:MBG domain-containing protein [Lachnospiraceae bacterium C1.1]